MSDKRMKKIFEAYKQILFSLLLIIAAAAAVIVFGIIIVAPLWAAATKYKTFYTIVVFAVAAILFLYYLFDKIKKEREFSKKIRNFLFNSFLILFTGFLIFSAILLASNGLYIHSIFIVALIFLISGVIKFFFFNKNNNEFK